ncbi:hypothetical protein [Bradyrhizobium australiense]|uniref:Uncharacterized protein n=1 Tax=Bradyrhizobium australiense TaxID=2721161 RepID=A0A7Y4GT71_9BRAD|nr:hypothetical protein [Bradyrhizobium australiense]NOJ41421.1 hypothetical protein [Bradyrhizobium australiense]
MPDLRAKQPFSAIVRAAISAPVRFLIAHPLVARRRKLKFEIEETLDLTRELRNEFKSRELGVGFDGGTLRSLTRVIIRVRNDGNTAIEEFSFEIEIPGEHHNCLTYIAARSRELDRVASISFTGKAASNSMSREISDSKPMGLTVKVVVGSALNRREIINLGMFFDGSPTGCLVHCRIPNTKIRIRSTVHF